MCINFLKKSRKNKTYFYCRFKKKEITFENCSKCKNKQYKKTKPIRKKTNKLNKLENKRYSIITKDLKHCYICGKKKNDTHEAIGGCNRRKSIEWGLTIPLCRGCHSELENNQELKRDIQQLGQKTFETKYSHELFMREFKKNYLD